MDKGRPSRRGMNRDEVYSKVTKKGFMGKGSNWCKQQNKSDCTNPNVTYGFCKWGIKDGESEERCMKDHDKINAYESESEDVVPSYGRPVIPYDIGRLDINGINEQVEHARKYYKPSSRPSQGRVKRHPEVKIPDYYKSAVRGGAAGGSRKRKRGGSKRKGKKNKTGRRNAKKTKRGRRSSRTRRR
tara:strand:+ start:201 stop:758 length:558 start_codon:yes stop_codon:yes gene_type:complete